MEFLVGNPIHVYGVIYRMVEKLPSVISGLQDCGMKEEVELVRTNILEKSKVTEADLVGAMQSLLRIQFTYSLDPVELSQGLIGGHQTQARLSLRECSDGARHPINEMFINILFGFRMKVQGFDAPIELVLAIGPLGTKSSILYNARMIR